MMSWRNVIPATACFIGAAIVAATGHDGWGWLLVIGALLIFSAA